MPKILIICDRPGWAFDAIAQALIKHNSQEDMFLEVFYLKGNESLLEQIYPNYDFYFAMHWSLLADLRGTLLERLFRARKPSTITRISERFPFLEPTKTITGIHAHHDWDARKTQPGHYVLPPRQLVEFLSKYRGVNAVSHRLYSLFGEAGLDTVQYTPNGVDMGTFKPISPLSDEGCLRVGYAGTKKRDWKAGITEYIEPLARLPGVDLKLAVPETGHRIPHAKMPEFYNDIDVYVCASSSEGFSLSVLEASACGRPVVTTRVGGCEDLIQDGFNGFFVERDVEDIAEKLGILYRDRALLKEMGRNNRTEVEAKWSWRLRVQDWYLFIRKSLLLLTV
jgi:glycosyltransferase involved in cell wall biosynthesis